MQFKKKNNNLNFMEPMKGTKRLHYVATVLNTLKQEELFTRGTVKYKFEWLKYTF